MLELVTDFLCFIQVCCFSPSALTSRAWFFLDRQELLVDQESGISTNLAMKPTTSNAVSHAQVTKFFAVLESYPVLDLKYLAEVPARKQFFWWGGRDIDQWQYNKSFTGGNYGGILPGKMDLACRYDDQSKWCLVIECGQQLSEWRSTSEIEFWKSFELLLLAVLFHFSLPGANRSEPDNILYFLLSAG